MDAKKKGRAVGSTRKSPYADGPDVWSVDPWCAGMGIGVSTFYVWMKDPKRRPKVVKNGNMLRIVESQGAYLQRMGEQQKLAA